MENVQRQFASRDAFLRINFLYQAAHAAMKENPDNLELIRFYTNTLKSIVKKRVLRLDPSMKRTLCKKCCMLLVPGVTALVRSRAHPQKHLLVKCLDCKTVKRFLSKSDYQLWCEQPQAYIQAAQPKIKQQQSKRVPKPAKPESSESEKHEKRQQQNNVDKREQEPKQEEQSQTDKMPEGSRHCDGNYKDTGSSQSCQTAEQSKQIEIDKS